MNIKIGKITRSHYQAIYVYINGNQVPGNNDLEKAAYVEIMHRLLGKMQNRLFANQNKQISLSLSATEAWAFCILYMNTALSGEASVYIYPVFEIINTQIQFFKS